MTMPLSYETRMELHSMIPSGAIWVSDKDWQLNQLTNGATRPSNRHSQTTPEMKAAPIAKPMGQALSGAGSISYVSLSMTGPLEEGADGNRARPTASDSLARSEDNLGHE
jgi:hypothetical protein